MKILFKDVRIITALIFLLSGISYSQTTLTHGYSVFLEKGLMIDALTYPEYNVPETLNVANWAASNFTSANTWTVNRAYTNGSYWGYWLTNSLSNLRDISAGGGYAKLVHVQYGDEQSISGDLSSLTSTVAYLKSYYPDQVIYLNNSPGGYGGVHTEISASTLRTYTTTVKPDMLHFTEYPFRWVDSGYTQDYEGGSPESMYIRMELYRKAGLAGLTGDGSQPIPVGMYVQHYATIDSPYVNDYEPTQSQVNLQTFAAWAFGFRKTTSFLYETRPDATDLDSILFDGIGDDGTPTDRFYEIAEMNRQSQNLSPALVKLISSDLRMKMGRREDGVYNPLPTDAANGVAVAAWDSSADAYLKDISATNLGIMNNGMEGDVIIGFFKPLDASLVEAGAENDTYFMIVNGLTDETGDAEDCLQNIHLEFDFSDTEITQLLRLNRDTGDVEVVLLTDEGNGIYSLDLVLDGGVGDLFKYDTGTAFVPEPITVLSLIIGGFGCVLRKKR